MPAERDTSEVLEEVWAMLARGVGDRRHACHTPTLVTVDAGGRPRARTVVLRGADRDAGTLRCHTDARAAKVDEIVCGGWAAWHVYDRKARVQLRLGGPARVLREGETADSAWRATRLMSRRCYLAPRPPGSQADGPSSNLPAALEDRDPTSVESEGGRANFAVVIGAVVEIEWLWLHHGGHRRVRFRREDAGGAWESAWIEP